MRIFSRWSIMLTTAMLPWIARPNLSAEVECPRQIDFSTVILPLDPNENIQPVESIYYNDPTGTYYLYSPPEDPL